LTKAGQFEHLAYVILMARNVILMGGLFTCGAQCFSYGIFFSADHCCLFFRCSFVFLLFKAVSLFFFVLLVLI
jgi:hypothetical protein